VSQAVATMLANDLVTDGEAQSQTLNMYIVLVRAQGFSLSFCRNFSHPSRFQFSSGYPPCAESR
jgi:hypothetical protein